jgi:hypothetical protein
MRPLHVWPHEVLSLCHHNKNGSENTVVKTVELTWVEYHIAEPKFGPFLSSFQCDFMAILLMGVHRVPSIMSFRVSSQGGLADSRCRLSLYGVLVGRPRRLSCKSVLPGCPPARMSSGCPPGYPAGCPLSHPPRSVLGVCPMGYRSFVGFF